MLKTGTNKYKIWRERDKTGTNRDKTRTSMDNTETGRDKTGTRGWTLKILLR